MSKMTAMMTVMKLTDGTAMVMTTAQEKMEPPFLLDAAPLDPDAAPFVPDAAPIVPDVAPFVPYAAPFVPDAAPCGPDATPTPCHLALSGPKATSSGQSSLSARICFDQTA